MKNTVICSKEQYVYFASVSYEGKDHDKAIAAEENLVFLKNTEMWADLGYSGFEAVNLTLHLPHKKPRKTDLTELQKKYNTQHAKERVCNEHAIRSIKRLRIVQEPLRLNAYDWADTLFQNATAIHNFRVRSPLRAYTRAGSLVKKLNFN